MRLRFFAVLALARGAAHLPLSAAAQTAQPPTQDSALVEEVRRLIAARVTSDVSGDSAGFHRLIVPGYVHVNDSGGRWTGEVWLPIIGRHRPDAASPTYQVTVVRVAVRRVDSVLLTDALVTLEMRSPSGAAVTSSKWRDMNALVRMDGQWRFAQHSETPVEALGGYPVVTAPDSAALGQFVGDYEWLPGLVDRITQRGTRLFMGDRDHPELGVVPLIAAGAEAFYPEDDSAALKVFVRDTTGRVTHYIARMAGGPVVIGRRVR